MGDTIVLKAGSLIAAPLTLCRYQLTFRAADRFSLDRLLGTRAESRLT